MKKNHDFSTEACAPRAHRFATTLLMVALLSCTTEIVGPRIATQLVLASSAQGAVNGQLFATPPTIHVADDEGNPVTGANFPVVLTVSDGASLTGPTTVSAIDGIAVFNSTGLAGPAGTYTLIYTATLAVGPRSASQSITLAPGAAASYIVSPSASNPAVGTVVTITAQLVDSHNSPISSAGKVVTWSVTGQNGSFSAATSQTDASGRATVSYTADTVDGKTGTITATDNSSISGSTTVMTVAGPAAKLAFNVQPSAAGWRTVMQRAVVVTIQDRYSNTVTSGATPVTLSIDANPGGATITGGGPIPGSTSGIATFPDLMLDQPGSGYTLRASSPGLTSATSATFDVSRVAILATLPPAEICLVGCGVKSLALSGTTVLFTLCDRPPGGDVLCYISTVPTKGGAVDRLTGVGTEPRTFKPYGGRLVVDGTYVNLLRVGRAPGNLTTTSGSILRAPLAGGASAVLPVPAQSANSGPDLEFDGTHFYVNWWWNEYNSTTGIGRTRASDGATQVLVSYFSWFAVAGGQLYFKSADPAGTIEKIDVAGGPATTVVTGVGTMAGPSYSPRHMLIVDNTLYWVEADGALRSAPLSGGVATTRATGVAAPLVSDGTYLYAPGTNSVLRFRLSDFSVTSIPTDSGPINHLAVDSEAIYWVSDHAVKKTQK